MAKCKNCGIEEQGYATLLDKRGYCYNPYCQSCSYDEVEQRNIHLQAQLDREIKINRKLKNCLSAFARRDNWKAIEGCADWLFLLDPLMAEETLKEIDNKE